MSGADGGHDDHGNDDRGGADRVRRAAVRLAAIAQTGLSYAEGDATKDYDASRYGQVADLAAELLSVVTGRDAGDLRLDLGGDTGYATPKVDVRAAVVDERERFLMLRERSDGRWSLPGGWADPGDLPGEAAVREVLEETGYPVAAVKLVAVWERDARGLQPPLPVSVFHLFFLCRVVGEPVAPQDLETLEVGWFPLDDLPELSTIRVVREELERVLLHHRDPSLPTEWD